MHIRLDNKEFHEQKTSLEAQKSPLFCLSNQSFIIVVTSGLERCLNILRAIWGCVCVTLFLRIYVKLFHQKGAKLKRGRQPFSDEVN